MTNERHDDKSLIGLRWNVTRHKNMTVAQVCDWLDQVCDSQIALWQLVTNLIGLFAAVLSETTTPLT